MQLNTIGQPLLIASSPKWEISLQYVARFVNNMSQQPNEENHLLFEWLITI